MQSHIAPMELLTLPIDLLLLADFQQDQKAISNATHDIHMDYKKNTSPSAPGPTEQIPNGTTAALKHQVPFNGLASHYPFDPNLYPLTNPPLYDPTMLPVSIQGGPRRRRISISNGQIGQIVNHEAFYIDDESLDDYYDGAGYRPHLHGPSQAHPQDDSAIAHRPTSDLVSMNALPLIQPAGPMSNTGGHVNPVNPAQAISGTPSPSVAGVPPPNQTLVYNNEVIFNPHDGPIPGTAAWKKERLLERNRLAASKCRQRKKNAQQQLQSNMAKFERELQDKADKLAKAEKVLAMYNSVLQQHFEGNTVALESLRPYVAQPLENIKFLP